MPTTATNYLSAAALAERSRCLPPRSKEVGHNQVVTSTHGHLHELGPVAVRSKLREANEQLTYWRGAKFRALHQRDKDTAGARVLLWENEVAAIRRRLRQLECLADVAERETATA